MVTLRSATGAGVSVSVTLLLALLGSVVPAGAAALAVLTRLPVAVELMAATTVKVAVPPAARLTLVLMLPALQVRIPYECIRVVRLRQHTIEREQACALIDEIDRK